MRTTAQSFDDLVEQVERIERARRSGKLDRDAAVARDVPSPRQIALLQELQADPRLPPKWRRRITDRMAQPLATREVSAIIRESLRLLRRKTQPLSLASTIFGRKEMKPLCCFGCPVISPKVLDLLGGRRSPDARVLEVLAGQLAVAETSRVASCTRVFPSKIQPRDVAPLLLNHAPED